MEARPGARGRRRLIGPRPRRGPATDELWRLAGSDLGSGLVETPWPETEGMSTMSATLGSLMLGTTDQDRLREWYTTVLPPDEEHREGSYQMLRYGDFWLFLDHRDDVQGSHPDPARTIVNFDVDDARAVVDRLEQVGAQWVAPLEDRDGSLFATAQDPDGNFVQIIQLSAEHQGQMAEEPTTAGPVDPTAAFSGFSVNDIAAAKEFYGGVLGVPAEDGPMGLLMLRVGGRQVLVYPKETHQPASYTVLNFPVADVHATVRDLKSRGVTLLQYDGFDQDAEGVAVGGEGPAIAWFTDPAGNVLSVLEQS